MKEDPLPMPTAQVLNPVDRLLNLFTEVRRGEAGSALLLALNIFLILTTYYVLKPVREALILSGNGSCSRCRIYGTFFSPGLRFRPATNLCEIPSGVTSFASP
jgi:hypothetical protein